MDSLVSNNIGAENYESDINFIKENLNNKCSITHNIIDNNLTEISTEDKFQIIHQKLRHAAELRKTNIIGSLKLCREVISESQSINYPEGTALAYRNAGISSRLLSNYDDAFQYFEKALDIYNLLSDKTGKAKVLNSIGNIYLNLSDYKYALEYLHKCLSIVEKTDDRLFEVDVLNNIALACQESGDYTSSLEYNLKSIQICSANNISVPESLLNNIGIVYQSIGDYDTALEYYINSLKIAEEKKDMLDTGYALGNISFIHSKKGRYIDALECLNKCQAIFSTIGNRAAEANAFYNIGRVYCDMKKYREAVESGIKALNINSEINDHSGKAAALLLIGDFYSKTGEGTKAKEFYINGLRVSQDIGDIINETDAYLKMGEMFFYEKNYAIAIDNFLMALTIAETRDSKKDISRAHKLIYDAYLASENLQAAIEHMQQHYNLEKHIFSIEYERKLKSLTIKNHYLSIENERKIALQEKEIYRLKNVELADVNSKLMRLIDEKNEFMAIAAHDLKNPLSGIHVFSKKINSNIDKYSKEQISKIAQEMETASDRMFKLIEKFLDVNMIESGKRQINEDLINASLTLNSVIELNSTNACEKNISIVKTIEPELYLKTDEDALSQVLDNLISNALKFTMPGKKIYINAGKKKSHILFNVRDEGPGITSKDMNRLFTRFSRLSAQPTGNEISTGLGLSIAKKLVLMLGGRIWCESKPPEGASFFIELPADNQ